MTKETLQLAINILGPTLILTALFFFYRKVYYHLKFVRLHSSELKNRSMAAIILNPFTILAHFYVFIPVFIKSERKKEGEELILESKIGNSLKTFWILFGGIIFLSAILSGLIHKMK